METSQCYRLGNITKPFGVKGQVIFFLDVDDPDSYAGLDSCFVEVKGSLVPYFFHIQAVNGNKATVLFEDLSPQEALQLVGCDLYLPLDMLPVLTGNQFYFHEVTGFRVIDSRHGDIGSVASIIEYPAQPLFQVMKGDREILIPVIDQVIDRVDRSERTIHITAPEGLIDLYLS